MIILAVLYTVVCLAGIVGNGVALAVYVRKKKRPTPQYFIIGLAIIDFFVCLVIMPYGIFAVIYPSILITQLCKLMSWLWHASISSSIFITAAIAVDRYFAVCKPLIFRVSPSYARVIIVASMIISLLLSAPVLIHFGIVYTANNSSLANATTYSKACTAVDPGYAGVNIYAVIIFIMLITLVSVAYGSVYTTLRRRASVGVFVQEDGERKATVSTIENASSGTNSTDRASTSVNRKHGEGAWNSAKGTRNKRTQVSGENIEDIRPDIVNSLPTGNRKTCCGLWKGDTADINQSNTSGHNSRNNDISSGVETTLHAQKRTLDDVKNKTAKMLLLVTITFIASWAPYWILVFLPASFWDTRSPFELQFYNFLKYFYVINNAINPIIYSFVNKKFRHDSFALFKKCFN